MKNLNRNKKRLCRFTIMEMLAASTVFVILMMIVMQIFSAMQDTCGSVQARTETYNKAQNVFTALTADLQAAVYSDDFAWTYYQPKSAASGTFPDVSTGFMSNPQFWFVTERGDHPSDSDIRMVVCYWLEPVPAQADPTQNAVYKTSPKRLRYQLCMGLYSSNEEHYTTPNQADKAESIYSFPKRFVDTVNASERRPEPLTFSNYRVSDAMTSIKIVLATNILWFDVIPYFQTPTGYALCSRDDLSVLPEALYIRMVMVDDTDKARAEFLETENGTADALSKEELSAAREFTRLIQIGRR